MYTPKHFAQDDITILHKMIENYNFATLYSQLDGEPYATHLPFMLDKSAGEYGTLITHLATANPHWRAFEGTEQPTRALVIFQGPHDYISPSWYVNQNTVPTWNYAVAHAYGTPQIIRDPQQLREMVMELTRRHETAINSPWDLDKSHEIVEKHTKSAAFVGLVMRIERLEGKYKFNQNKSKADQHSVIEHLKQSNSSMAPAIIDIMQDNLITAASSTKE